MEVESGKRGDTGGTQSQTPELRKSLRGEPSAGCGKGFLTAWNRRQD